MVQQKHAGSGVCMKNSTDLSLGKKGKSVEESPRCTYGLQVLLCFTLGYNFKFRFVKAGHEQVRNRKCILLFLCKIMIIKMIKNRFSLLALLPLFGSIP